MYRSLNIFIEASYWSVLLERIASPLEDRTPRKKSPVPQKYFFFISQNYPELPPLFQQKSLFKKTWMTTFINSEALWNFKIYIDENENWKLNKKKIKKKKNIYQQNTKTSTTFNFFLENNLIKMNFFVNRGWKNRVSP